MRSWSRASNNNNNSLQINRSYSPQASKSATSNAKSLSSVTENKSYSHNDDDEVEDEVDVENHSEQNGEEDEYDWSDEEFTFEGGSLDEEDNDKVTTFTAATRLLEKRKEMMDVHGALKAKKEEYHIRLKAIKEKERQLGKKRNDLTDNIIELDKFIGVCV